MARRIVHAGNTLVPAVLVMESLGFALSVSGAQFIARRADEEFMANDPVSLLGLVRLTDLRTWDWAATDDEIDATLTRLGLD